MIKDRNIAPDAAIQVSKILGGAGWGAGEVLYVGTAGTASYNWYKSRVPASKLFTSLNKADSACAAAQNDKIIVLPQHTETISAAGGVTLSKAGVEVIGCGVGTYRPTFTLGTATAATFLITGNNVSVSNIKIDSTGFDAIIAPITITNTAGGVNFTNVEHYFAKTGAVSLLGMRCTTAASANYLTIDNCYFHGDPAANCTNYLQLVGGDSIKVTDSHIAGAFTTSLGCINNITVAVSNINITRNILVNSTASATKVIVLLTGQTGRIRNNVFAIGTGTAPVTADALEVIGGNYYKAAVGVAAGTLV